MLPLPCERHVRQRLEWPAEGRHILAHYDDATVVVYQAYRPSIAQHVLTHGRFGGSDFAFARMSWIKPGFLWMMYRSGWATKPGQEMVLALRIRRRFFDGIVAAAVPTSYNADRYPTSADWRDAGRAAAVRVQWDPDHDPQGAKLERRSIQLGLRGEALRAFANVELVEAIDMTSFVRQQRQRRVTGELLTPLERIYPLDVGASVAGAAP
jgi:Domain of unknown function (DUF4291)